MNNLAALEANGVRIHYEENWVGEVGVDRHAEPDFSRVRSVYLGLTPKDWCAIGMHEGGSYVGGCGGTSSAIQDHVNSIFREGGWVDADTFFTIGQMAKSHPDGFKDWGFLGTMSQKRFDARCAQHVYSRERQHDSGPDRVGVHKLGKMASSCPADLHRGGAHLGERARGVQRMHAQAAGRTGDRTHGDTEPGGLRRQPPPRRCKPWLQLRRAHAEHAEQ